MNNKLITIQIMLYLFISCASSAWATTYWISPTGAAANLATCSGSTPLSGASACSYDKANGSAVVAGDIVYYRAGIYSGITGNAINPSNTGTAGKVITFTAYNSESVEFVGSGLSSQAVNLNSDYGTVRSYIKVNSLRFTNFMRHLWILKGQHNEISNCSFTGYPPTATDADIQGTWSASYIYRQAMYNWIHDCTFGKWGGASSYGNDFGVVFQLGLEESATDLTRYNMVERCEMYGGGHHVVSTNGSYNIYRNNWFHNEPWMPSSSPTFATRTGFQIGVDGDGKYNLVEGNRWGYGGPKNKIEIGGNGSTIAGAYNIWRNNTFLQIYTAAMWVTHYSGDTDVKYNHIYNNTYWHGGYGRYQYYPSGTASSSYWDNSYTHPIDIDEGAGTYVYGNIFKNNLFWQNSDLRGTAYSIISHSKFTLPVYQSLANNRMDNANDPLFIDISGMPDPTKIKSQYDFHLQAGSPAIDQGAFLTTVTSANGTGTTFTVADASYFWYDIGGMASNIPGTKLATGDVIQLKGQSTTTTITNINYATNTITVNNPLTWTNGLGIALAYSGSAPDVGAYEFITAPLPAPLNLLSN